MFLFNVFRRKKGSVILSILASGVVAASIVATHQVTQNFVSGAAQEFNLHTANVYAQRFLTIASLMVNRNLITCSNKITTNLVDKIHLKKSVGCKVNSTESMDILDKLGLIDKNTDYFSPLNLKQTKDVSNGAVVLNGRDSKGIIHLKPSSIFYGVGTVTWNLRNWHEPAIRALFGSITEGYFCQHKETSQIITDSGGKCKALEVTASRDEIQKDATLCGASDEGYCNYFSVSDNDDQAIMISVEVPYSAITKEDARANKKLTINAVVRRPVAFMTTYIGEQGRIPSCNFHCETVEDSGTGLGQYRRCTQLSEKGHNKGSDLRYPDNTNLIHSMFHIKNHGPGTIYNARFKREDIENGTNRVLVQTMTHPILNPIPPPPLGASTGSSVGTATDDFVAAIDDTLPCYLSSVYPSSIKNVNTGCEVTRTSTIQQTATKKVTRQDAVQSNLKNILGDVVATTKSNIEPQTAQSWVATTNSSMSQVKKVSSTSKEVHPVHCEDRTSSTITASSPNAKGVSLAPSNASVSASSNHHVDCTTHKGGLAMIKQPEYPLCNYVRKEGVDIRL